MEEVIHLVNEMSPYLLLGFLFAGLLHAFVPSGLWSKHLSANNTRSVINAALLGIPLPLCSCGVIPTAMSLRREGAGKGATAGFLIATPQTGIDSILATYGLMGLPFTIVRPIAALITSLMGGILVNLTQSKAERQQAPTPTPQEQGKASEGFLPRLKKALEYAFVDMVQDIGKWLVVGLVVAAMITVLVPEEAFETFKGNTLLSMLLVLAIALPMYICATGSIPIAVALMLKGLTPGAALVLLMAGPAANFASILVVRKVMGTRTLLIYLLSIILGAIGFGMLIDWLQYNGYVNFTAALVQQDACCGTESTPWWAWAGTVLLLLLLIHALIVKPYILKQGSACRCHGACHQTHNHQGKHKNDETQQIQNREKTYHILGMSCNHCRMNAEQALRNVSGVSHASVELDSCEAHVSGTATKEQLAAAIEAIGFTLTE